MGFDSAEPSVDKPDLHLTNYSLWYVFRYQHNYCGVTRSPWSTVIIEMYTLPTVGLELENGY